MLNCNYHKTFLFLADRFHVYTIFKALLNVSVLFSVQLRCNVYINIYIYIYIYRPRGYDSCLCIARRSSRSRRGFEPHHRQVKVHLYFSIIKFFRCTRIRNDPWPEYLLELVYL